jgi:CHASE2 domain-containing sensor protein
VSAVNNEPTRLLDRLVGACFAVLVGAMALYGAVQIVSAVWLPLTVTIAVVVGIAIGVWLWRRHVGW